MEASRNALKAMRALAEKLHLHGVSVVIVLDENNKYQEPLVDVVDQFVDEAIATKDWSKTGANYWAIAMSKIAEMLETRKPSGSGKRPARAGEFGYKGGIPSYWHNLEVLIAFSGGTEEQDLQITKAGTVAFHKTSYTKSGKNQEYESAVFHGDRVLYVLPAKPKNNLEEDVIECVVIRGDSASEARLFHADAYVLKTMQASDKRGIKSEVTLQNIKRKRIIPLL